MGSQFPAIRFLRFLDVFRWVKLSAGDLRKAQVIFSAGFKGNLSLDICFSCSRLKQMEVRSCGKPATAG